MSMRLESPRDLVYRRNPGPGNQEPPVATSIYEGPCDWIITIDVPGTTTVKQVESEDDLSHEQQVVTFMLEADEDTTFFQVSGLRFRPAHHTNTLYYTCRHLSSSARFEPFLVKIAVPAGTRAVVFGADREECAEGCQLKSISSPLEFHIGLSGQKRCKDYKKKEAAAKKAADDMAAEEARKAAEEQEAAAKKVAEEKAAEEARKAAEE